MLRRHINLALPTLLVVLFIGSAYAEKDHDKDHHHEEKHHKEGHDDTLEAGSAAHVHGAAELLIVLEGKELQIEFQSPAVNLVGFEHAAKNEEQRAKVDSTRLTLENASSLFQLSSGSCSLSTQKIELGDLLATDKAHKDEHDDEHHEEKHASDDDEHKEHSAHSDESAHSSDESAHSSDENAHSDITAEYSYTCEQGDEVTSLVTTMTEEFPGVESLDVQWIVGGRQGAVVLTSEQRIVSFR